MKLFLSLIFSRSRGPAIAQLFEKCKCENNLQGAPYFIHTKVRLAEFLVGTRGVFRVCGLGSNEDKKKTFVGPRDCCVHMHICGSVYDSWEYLNFELLGTAIISQHFQCFQHYQILSSVFDTTKSFSVFSTLPTPFQYFHYQILSSVFNTII
jgi:hypothetical protein